MKHVILVLLVLAALIVPAQAVEAQSGCHLVNHTVGRVYYSNGTSRVQRLTDVALRYNTSTSNIIARNGLVAGAGLWAGQTLSVLSCPVTAVPTPRPRRTPVYTGNPCRLIGLCS